MSEKTKYHRVTFDKSANNEKIIHSSGHGDTHQKDATMGCCWKKKQKPNRGLMALAQGSLSFVTAYSAVLNETEDQLEKQIDRENRAPPKTAIGKVRRTGEKAIHSKQVLLCIVFLNIVDCILVLGELILDIYFLKGILENAEAKNIDFVVDMKDLYPAQLSFLEDDGISRLHYEILHARVDWDGHPPSFDNFTSPNSTAHSVQRRAAGNLPTVSDGSNSTYKEQEYGHSLEEDLAHGFHKASVTILAILAAETIFKVFCLGKVFFEHKLEVFDGFIVFGSFALDLVFIKGFSGMHIRDLVVILAFLVPWRVIRVVNSLVVAVIDHEHFRMKLLYKQKKAVSNELKTANSDNKILQQNIKILEQLAISSGVTQIEINRHTAFLQTSKTKQKSSSLAAFAANFKANVSSSTTSLVRNGQSFSSVNTIQSNYNCEP